MKLWMKLSLFPVWINHQKQDIYFRIFLILIFLLCKKFWICKKPWFFSKMAIESHGQFFDLDHWIYEQDLIEWVLRNRNSNKQTNNNNDEREKTCSISLSFSERKQNIQIFFLFSLLSSSSSATMVNNFNCFLSHSLFDD